MKLLNSANEFFKSLKIACFWIRLHRPIMPQFKQSRWKIDRANKHISDIKSRVAGLLESVTSTIEINPKTREETVKHDFVDRKAFFDIALMLGDAIHNLNCALDYAWLQTVERLAPQAVSKFAKFPVRKTVNDLKGALNGAEIHLTAPDLVKFMLDEIQPCEGGNIAIWAVHSLDIRDKHRLLIPVFADAAIVDIRVENHAGESFTGHTFATTMQPPYCVTWEAGIHIKDKGKLAAEVHFEDGESGDFLHVPDTVSMYSHGILKVVEAFEGFMESTIHG